MADWTSKEVELVVTAYLSMLAKEIAGEPYNKSAERKKLAPLLDGRSDGSIEFKFQNISAVLIELGGLYIRGYKPRYNYQGILEQECIKQLNARQPAWENAFETFIDQPPILVETADFVHWLDVAPDSTDSFPKHIITPKRNPFKINYLEREQRNLEIGQTGEQIVFEYERWRLQQIGKDALADKVEWISKLDDGAGFDILSKNDNGSDRLIEVKSTKLTKETPIFFSDQELRCSQENRDKYHLYRVFNLSKNPKMFMKEGDFGSFCKMEAVQFKGYF